MNNLSSYCGLVDAKIRASDKDLPVSQKEITSYYKKRQKTITLAWHNKTATNTSGHPKT